MTPTRISERVRRIKLSPSTAAADRASELRRQGQSIVSLVVGEPDFDTPKHIQDAATAAMAAGWTHYGPAAGLPDFRKAIAASWKARRGIPCEAANVVVTPGAKQVLLFAMLALLEPGDVPLGEDRRGVRIPIGDAVAALDGHAVGGFDVLVAGGSDGISGLGVPRVDGPRHGRAELRCARCACRAVLSSAVSRSGCEMLPAWMREIMPVQ